MAWYFHHSHTFVPVSVVMVRCTIAMFLAAIVVAPGVCQSPGVPVRSATETLTSQPFNPPLSPTAQAAVERTTQEQPSGEAFDPARWQVDLMMGAPIAVRVQRQIGDSKLWGEAGAGLYLVWPIAYAGLRVDAIMFENRRHEVLFRPGVDVSWVYAFRLFDRDRSVGFILADADFVWRRKTTDGGSTQIGLKLGVAAPLTSGASGVFPTVALLYGFTF